MFELFFGWFGAPALLIGGDKYTAGTALLALLDPVLIAISVQLGKRSQVSASAPQRLVQGKQTRHLRLTAR